MNGLNGMFGMFANEEHEHKMADAITEAVLAADTRDAFLMAQESASFEDSFANVDDPILKSTLLDGDPEFASEMMNIEMESASNPNSLVNVISKMGISLEGKRTSDFESDEACGGSGECCEDDEFDTDTIPDGDEEELVMFSDDSDECCESFEASRLMREIDALVG